MYSKYNYKKDGERLKDLIIQQNNECDFNKCQKIVNQRKTVELRMTNFASKNFVGKYFKYDTYCFDVKGNLCDIITHYVHPTKLMEIKIDGVKHKYLSGGFIMTPYCNYGITEGKYFIKESYSYLNGYYLEEITENEWTEIHSKLVKQNEANAIHNALVSIGNAAIVYVNTNPTKEQKKAEDLAESREKLWRQSQRNLKNIVDKRVNELKKQVTEEQFNTVLKEIKNNGFFKTDTKSYLFNNNKKKK